MLLDGAGGSELVEDALGDPGEDVDHGVDPLLLGRVDELDHPEAVAHELALEEAVHQVHLRDDVDQAEDLAGEVTVGVQVVSL